MERESHLQKTQGERREYWDNIIRARAGPTIDDELTPIDSTDHALEDEKRPISALTSTKPPSVFRKYLREHGTETVIALILIPFLSWGACQIFDMNREIGEISVSINSLKENQSNTQAMLNKLEERVKDQIGRVSSDMNRTEQRVDELFRSRFERRGPATANDHD